MAAGTSVGLGFFPLLLGSADAGPSGAIACAASDYAKPAVPIAALPASARTIADALAMQTPAGSTPTTPALQGAVAYVKSYLTAAPGHNASILLVTDGVPTGCISNTVTAAVAVATSAFTGQPSIKTYVIGLGATSALDALALAGSGGTTHYFPASGDIAAAVASALRAIASPSQCSYALPASDGGNLDYARLGVEVRVGIGGGATTDIQRLAGAAACGASDGWYYDVDPTVGHPARVTLCPHICEPVKTTAGSAVTFLIDCFP